LRVIGRVRRHRPHLRPVGVEQHHRSGRSKVGVVFVLDKVLVGRTNGKVPGSLDTGCQLAFNQRLQVDVDRQHNVLARLRLTDDFDVDNLVASIDLLDDLAGHPPKHIFKRRLDAFLANVIVAAIRLRVIASRRQLRIGDRADSSENVGGQLGVGVFAHERRSDGDTGKVLESFAEQDCELLVHIRGDRDLIEGAVLLVVEGVLDRLGLDQPTGSADFAGQLNGQLAAP